MAAEIRDREDQLYHYDHEYRLLEQELESLRRRLAATQQVGSQQAAPHHATPQPVPAENSPFDFLPQQRSIPGQINPESIEAAPIEQVPAPAVAPSPPGNSSNGAGGRSNGPSTKNPPSILNAPSTTNPSNSSTAPVNPTTNPPSITPENLPLPTRPAFPPKNDINPPSQSPQSTDFDFNAGDLVVPTITTGALTPPSIDPKQIAASPDRDLELSLTQVEIPSQFANEKNSSAKITSAIQVVSDKRIVELAFNPALTRAISFDGDHQDDGLYLVLQPKNEQGQVVPLAAMITVEVIDPSREDSKSSIGQWRYTAEEVEAKIQPLGSKQGIHLTLPWNGPNPKSDRVTVVATYRFENGRKLVARKEVFLNNNAGYKTVWTPRASRDGTQGSSTSGPVVTASAVQAVGNGQTAVQSLGTFSTPEMAPAPSSLSSGPR